MKIIMMHGWIGVGKSTLLTEWFRTWKEQKGSPVPYKLIKEHNTHSIDTKEVLDCFYTGKISKVWWETHQLIIYWEQAMEALRSLTESHGLICDRSFVDVHSLMLLYLSETEYNQLHPLYDHFVTLFMEMCIKKQYFIQPLIVTKPPLVAWQQFIKRNRSAEVLAFTQEGYIQYMRKYEEATKTTMGMLRDKYGNALIRDTKIIDSLSVPQTLRDFDEIADGHLTLPQP